MTVTFDYQEVFKETLTYFDGDDLATSVFLDKYCLKNNNQQFLEKSPRDMHMRIASEIARIEKTKFKTPYTVEEIYSYLEGFKRIVPQGSPMYAIGNDYQYVSLSNCFAPGTKIFTVNDGPKNIEDVVIGDTTVTHTGKIRTISQVHKNKLDGRQLFNLRVKRSVPICVTGNHKFLSITKEQLEWNESPTWNSVEHLRKGDFVAIPHRTDNSIKIEDIDLKKIIPEGDLISSTGKRYELTHNELESNLVYHYGGNAPHKKLHRSIKNCWKVDEDFAYFLGLWYGDGCVFNSWKVNRKGERERLGKQSGKHNSVRGITFTFNSKERNFIDFVSTYGERLFGIAPSVCENENQHTVQVVFASTLIGVAFETLFGRKCDGKKLHKSIYSWNRSLVTKLIQGVLDTDGGVTKAGGTGFSLKNRKLSESFYHLSRSFGIASGSTGKTGYYGESQVWFPKNSEFTKNSGKTYEDGRLERLQNEQESTHLIIDGTTYLAIESKEKCDDKHEYVYTVGVEVDHSYSVEGLMSLNCFVVETPYDSYGSIHLSDEQLSQISKRRGGCGIDISKLRPSGTPTKNAARTSTGILSFMERFSNTIREVGQAGRRGALMITLSVHHPQILDFVNVKRDLRKVTGANISVRLTDEFLQAVKEDKDYEQRFPVDSKTPQISQMVSAKKVWMEIIASAHTMAEPGLLFWDTIISESPADCYADVGFQTESTNPCSELPLSCLDSCRLCLINLYSYVRNPFTKKAEFDFVEFYKDSQVMQRFMDDIIDLELESIDRIIAKIKNDPEPKEIKHIEQRMWEKVRTACYDGRRTGSGITALGDALAALGIKYGSKDSIRVTGEIYQTLKLACYRSSVDMAKELGAFPVWNYAKEKDNPFLNRIKDEDPKLYSDMKKYGRRNIALLTTAPAGSVSIETRTSSGIEPIFMMSYTRRKKVNPTDADKRVDFVDPNGDSWQEFTVYHPKIREWMRVSGKSDLKQSPYYGCCAEDLDWKQRVELQAIAQRHTDHSLSSTVNLPEDVSVERVAEIYETAWESKCKGMTVYRKNCRTGVLVDNQNGRGSKIKKSEAPKRPATVPCGVHKVKVKGESYFVLVGLLADEPYEVFAGKNSLGDIKKGTVTKLKRGVYKAEFEDGSCLDSIVEHCSDEEEAVTRLISTSLRHGADIGFIVHQLEKVKGDMVGFAKSIQRTLKHYIKDGTKVSGESCGKCSSTSLSRQEGCVTCMNCGWSKCS